MYPIWRYPRFYNNPYYLHLNKNKFKEIVSAYFLDRFAKSVYTIKCKKLAGQSGFPLVSLYSNQLGRLVPATDQYLVDKYI